MEPYLAARVFGVGEKESSLALRGLLGGRGRVGSRFSEAEILSPRPIVGWNRQCLCLISRESAGRLREDPHHGGVI